MKYNLDADGYYYIDPNNLPFEIVTLTSLKRRYLNTPPFWIWLSNPETVFNLFTDRIESLDSSDLPGSVLGETHLLNAERNIPRMLQKLFTPLVTMDLSREKTITPFLLVLIQNLLRT